MDIQHIFDFLATLKENNNREWLQENRKPYEKAKKDFENVVSTLITHIEVFDARTATGLLASDCIFRIARDVRFSKDKSPYKTNFGAVFVEGGRKSDKPCYYLHIEPNACFVGAGVYMPPAPILKKIREEIDYNGEALVNILQDTSIQQSFSLWNEDKVKSAPKGFEKTHPHIELLKLKSFILECKLENTFFERETWIEDIASLFQKTKKYNDWLYTAFELV